MKLTVAICTWNRSALLRQTLGRVVEIERPQCEWEIVVVNNNCTDDTDQVIAEFSNRLPIRGIVERTQGLASARNAAVSAARGEYIVWIDDDVLVDRRWLVTYLEAINRWPEAVVFGGPIKPVFEGEPPKWLTESWDEISTVFGARPPGEEGFIGNKIRLPMGANYVVRTQVQRRFPYNPRLGRIGTSGMLGEESQVLGSMLAKDTGAVGRWVPEALVEHWVPRHHQTVRFLWNYYFLWGRTLRYTQSYAGDRTFLGRPYWMYRDAITSAGMLAFNRIFRGSREWVLALWRCATALGALTADTRTADTRTK